MRGGTWLERLPTAHAPVCVPAQLQEEAWDIADQVVIFNKGLIEQQGTPQVDGRDSRGCSDAVDGS